MNECEPLVSGTGASRCHSQLLIHKLWDKKRHNQTSGFFVLTLVGKRPVNHARYLNSLYALPLRHLVSPRRSENTPPMNRAVNYLTQLARPRPPFRVHFGPSDIFNVRGSSARILSFSRRPSAVMATARARCALRRLASLSPFGPACVKVPPSIHAPPQSNPPSPPNPSISL